MSASVLLTALCVAVAMLGIALETTTRRLRPAPARPFRAPSAPRVAPSEAARRTRVVPRLTTEQGRWVALMTVPLCGGTLSVAAALATGVPWFFAGAVALVPSWIALLAYLALSSDTNGRSGRMS